MSSRRESALGDFLRSRRARVSPSDVGLPATTGRRRTTGLRREEVAMLAGVSIEYYTRLEQGRQHRPSRTVLEAVAEVLRLDDDEREHLFALPEVAERPARPAPRAARPQRVREEVRRLLEIVQPYPAHLLGRTGDLLAANTPGLRLLPGLTDWEPRRRNTIRYTFLHPAARALYRNWSDVAAAAVAHLRTVAGVHPDAPDLTALVGELAVRSREFAALWDRYDVRARTHGVKVFDHPEVGGMTLRYEALSVARGDGQRLIVYQAAPGSPDHDAMMLLGMGGDAVAEPTGEARPAYGRSSAG
jgi:transcriptional regulator with XRE-family HTH domain